MTGAWWFCISIGRLSYAPSGSLICAFSTIDQTTANQERELREIASRMDCEIVKV